MCELVWCISGWKTVILKWFQINANGEAGYFFQSFNGMEYTLVQDG